MSKFAVEFGHLPKDSETCALLRSTDWAATTLGHPSLWPEALRLQLNICFESAFAIAVWWGPDLIQFYNDAYRPILGATKHPRAFGSPAIETWPDIWSTIGPMVSQVVEQGVAVKGEDMPLVLERNGYPEQCYFTFSYSPIRNISGQIDGMFTAAVETSKRVLAERRQAVMFDLQERLHSLAEPQEIMMAAAEMLGNYLGVDRCGYAEIDATGQYFNVLRDWTKGDMESLAGHHNLNNFGLSYIAELRAGRSAVFDDANTSPLTQDEVAKVTFPAVRTRAAISVPLVKSGRLAATLYLTQIEPHRWTEQEIQLTRDVAERTWSAVERARVQETLRIERDRSQAVFDTMLEGFGLIDCDWIVRYMNAEGLRLGDRAEQLVIGGNHWVIWPEAIGSELERTYRRVMHTRQPEIVEYQHVLSDGSVICLETRVFPGIDGGLGVFFRNVTTRKEAEEKLRDADRRKDEFLAMLAHELRNPLAPIGAAAELLQRVKLDEEQVRKTSAVIGRQVSHMTGLIDDLLDVSRVTRGLIELDKVALDIQQVVNEAVEQVSPLIRARGHELTIRLAPQTALVKGDKKRLVQVVANILNNAAKYTAEGGHIALHTSVQDQEVLIEVTDDGIGMMPETERHAFDLFAQAERSSDRSSGGLGLGLALVKSPVELRGGSVTCRSNGLGQGSAFSICLPCPAERSQDASPPAIKNVAPATPVASLNVLVVDDNVDAAEMLKLLLQSMGHEVRVEHGPLRALEQAKRYKPQVCLVDIGLPEIDGNEVARRLRAQPENAGAVLIAVTGYGQESDRANSSAAGFDHHLVKPVDTTSLTLILAAITRA